MIMHVHKDRTEKLDLKLALNDFVGESEYRTGILLSISEYWLKILHSQLFILIHC